MDERDHFGGHDDGEEDDCPEEDPDRGESATRGDLVDDDGTPHDVDRPVQEHPSPVKGTDDSVAADPVPIQVRQQGRDRVENPETDDGQQIRDHERQVDDLCLVCDGPRWVE